MDAPKEEEYLAQSRARALLGQGGLLWRFVATENHLLPQPVPFAGSLVDAYDAAAAAQAGADLARLNQGQTFPRPLCTCWIPGPGSADRSRRAVLRKLRTLGFLKGPERLAETRWVHPPPWCAQCQGFFEPLLALAPPAPAAASPGTGLQLVVVQSISDMPPLAQQAPLAWQSATDTLAVVTLVLSKGHVLLLEADQCPCRLATDVNVAVDSHLLVVCPSGGAPVEATPDGVHLTAGGGTVQLRASCTLVVTCSATSARSLHRVTVFGAPAIGPRFVSPPPPAAQQQQQQLSSSQVLRALPAAAKPMLSTTAVLKRSVEILNGLHGRASPGGRVCFYTSTNVLLEHYYHAATKRCFLQLPPNHVFRVRVSAMVSDTAGWPSSAQIEVVDRERQLGQPLHALGAASAPAPPGDPEFDGFTMAMLFSARYVNFRASGEGGGSPLPPPQDTDTRRERVPIVVVVSQ